MSPPAASIQSVTLLVVEDSAEDLELIGDALRDAGLEPAIRGLDTEPAFRAALSQPLPDAILADWTLPEFSGARALQIARELAPEVPFLFVSGTISEAAALSGLRQGAVDYVFKHQLDKLGPTVIRAIAEARGRQALITSEERYRGLFETAQDGIFILEADSSRILEANPFICELLGMAPQEVLGRQLWELGVFRDQQGALEIFKALQQQGYVRHDNLMLQTANGQIREVEFVSNSYDAGATAVIQCNIRDISDRRAAERLARRYQGEVLQSLHQIVGALVSLNECRDPYTAGHEQRVSVLASAIAIEMKLSPQQVEGIRISGLVHDIGKFTIPAELLTKPTRLSREELALVRTHAEAGYEALRSIQFPWPVAEAVRQHHERLDGSGYPQGLKGLRSLWRPASWPLPTRWRRWPRTAPTAMPWGSKWPWPPWRRSRAFTTIRSRWRPACACFANRTSPLLPPPTEAIRQAGRGVEAGPTGWAVTRAGPPPAADSDCRWAGRRRAAPSSGAGHQTAAAAR